MRLPPRDRVIVVMLVVFSVFNVTLDLALIRRGADLPGLVGRDWAADLWAIYAEADRFWIAAPWSLAQESFNVWVTTLVNLALIVGIVRGAAWRHALQLRLGPGHIDPLTGEGIQYAMDGGEIAADTLDEALAAGDLGAAFLKRYQDRGMTSFGRDFRWSWAMAKATVRFPSFLDGCAALMRRRGADFLVEWGEAMTGARPKRAFMRPRVVVPIMGETVRQWWRGPAAMATAAERV